MAGHRWIVVAAVLAAVLLAGCTAPQSTTGASGIDAGTPGTDPGDTGSETPGTVVSGGDGADGNGTPDGGTDPGGTDGGDGDPGGANDTASGIAVDGSLPVDAGRIYGRVTDLLDADVDPPEEVQVYGPDDDPPVLPGQRQRPRFWAVMGVETAGLPDDGGRLTNGVVLPTGEIIVFPGDGSNRTIHYVLAHEYVHYVQVAQDRNAELLATLDTAVTDELFVRRSLVEGVAVYATDRYADRYLPGNVSNSALYRDLDDRTETGSYEEYVNSMYLQGWQYVRTRLSDPADHGSIYPDPPSTSAAVIRGPGAAVERRPVNVTVEDSRRWLSQGSDRMGEGFLRVALRNGLDRSVAHDAAAGWTNDSLRIFRSTRGGNDSYAWTIRWSDRANATAFEEAFRAYLDARGNRSGEEWTVDGVGFDLRTLGDTTVVLVGEERFVRETTVEGGNGTVELGLPATDPGPGAGVAPGDPGRGVVSPDPGTGVPSGVPATAVAR